VATVGGAEVAGPPISPCPVWSNSSTVSTQLVMCCGGVLLLGVVANAVEAEEEEGGEEEEEEDGGEETAVGDGVVVVAPLVVGSLRAHTLGVVCAINPKRKQAQTILRHRPLFHQDDCGRGRNRGRATLSFAQFALS
jgi:hypothetical protein